MFLTDAELQQMTGLVRGKHRPSTLRKWLQGRGMTENIDFYQRYDGWYSVMRPAPRAAVEPRPKIRLGA